MKRFDIVIISFGDVKYDGRLIEIIKNCEEAGSTYVISSKSPNNKSKIGLIISYLFFLFKSVAIFSYLRLKNKKIILFLDNFYTAPIGNTVHFLFKKTKIVQDCRELYFKEEMPGLGYYLCLSEEKLMKKSSLVFCGNSFRANIMKDKFGLENKPVVFDNIRFLEKNSYSKTELEDKYKTLFDSKWNVISTGGYSLARKTEELVRSFKDLDKFSLYIIGSGLPKEKKILEEIIVNEEIKNVFFLNKIPMNELSFVLSKCQIGVVAYGQHNLNNEYCSSGKIYEYMGLGIPFVATENIPLKEICEQFNVGYSCNDFQRSLLNVSTEYEVYKKNITTFLTTVDLDENNRNMISSIKKILTAEE
ncbi:glycosyltransferase [Vagococcus fluvialis]|uniref:glycosyltransferase n=1 Tax=Vagococcus fluvialis TaxID=2738 RepID=UPI003B5BE919